MLSNAESTLQTLIVCVGDRYFILPWQPQHTHRTVCDFPRLLPPTSQTEKEITLTVKEKLRNFQPWATSAKSDERAAQETTNLAQAMRASSRLGERWGTSSGTAQRGQNWKRILHLSGAAPSIHGNAVAAACAR